MYYEGTEDKQKQRTPQSIIERIKALPMKKYRRNQMKFKCVKVEEKIPVQDKTFLIKWAKPGDWICWPIGKDGTLLTPHVCAGEIFGHEFVEISAEEKKEEKEIEKSVEKPEAKSVTRRKKAQRK